MPLQIDPSHPLALLLKDDKRYAMEAYLFIFEALQYAQRVLGMGEEKSSEAEPSETPGAEPEPGAQRHVTGQQLCEAIRRYALHQYGYMAKTVLNSWGLQKTGDFGELVYNLIQIGQMRKTPNDSRVDFENLYDFDDAFQKKFRFSTH